MILNQFLNEINQYNSKPMLKITDFVTLATQLAMKSCQIIKQIYQSHTLNAVDKSQCNPVTAADIKIQSLIKKYLKSAWPQINIVGEQQTEYQGKLEIDLNKKFKKSMKSFLGSLKFESLDLKKVCVWIDPLDGTYSYTKGQLDEVTVLIGLSYEQQAQIGVIGSPYKSTESGIYNYQPRVYFGLQKIVGQINQQYKIKQLCLQKNEQITIAMSKNRCKKQYQRLSSISKKHIKVSGLGKKILLMLENTANCIICVGNKSNRWDICAGQAIIKALGGTTTSLAGNQIIYKQRDCYQNTEGLVLSWNIGHSKIVQYTKLQII